MERKILNNKSRNKTWVCLAALMAVFALSLREFIFEGKIVFQGMEAWHYFPVSMHYFQSIIQGNYPFFDFLFSVGFDALGDSQQQLLHPLKMIMVLIGVEPVKINTLFLMAHLFIGMLGVYLYAQFMLIKSYRDSLTNTYGIFFAPVLLLLSLAFYTNIPHMVFGCTLAYFPFMLLLTEKIMVTPKRRYFFFLALVVMLILFIGNYAMQWITLLFMVMYMGGMVFMDKRLACRALIVLSAITFGFLLALVQLVPVLDMMFSSSRASLASLDMFQQSGTPLQWLGYFSPGAVYLQFKYAHEAYYSYTGNWDIEGVHYMGLIPLALFLYSIWKRKTLPREIYLFQGLGLLMGLRALGLFSLVNIFLNTLPIFGQFRIPVRTFFMVDFVLAMVAAYVLVSNIDRDALRKVISTLLVITFAFNLFSILSIQFWGVMSSQGLPTVTLLEYGYSFGGCFVLLISLLLFSNRFSAVFNKKGLILGLIILSMIDLGFQRIGLPLHWGTPTAQEIKAQNIKVDARCNELGASRVWMDFKWPNYRGSFAVYDVPRFPLVSSEGPYYESERWTPHYVSKTSTDNIQLHGASCYFGDSVITSTLTPMPIKHAMNWAKEELTHDEFLSFLSILGYKHFAKLKSEDTRLIGIEDVEVLKPSPPTEGMLEKFKLFLETQSVEQKGLFYNLYKSAYDLLVRFEVSDWLPRQHFELTPVPGVGSVFGLTQPMYYIVLDDHAKLLPYKIKGTFLVFPENVLKPVEVVYVPMGFIVGLIGSIVCFALFLLVSLTRSLNPLFGVYGLEHGKNNFGEKYWDFLHLKLGRAWSVFLDFLVSNWLKKYGGIFIFGSILTMPLAAVFMTRQDFAFPFLFLIFLLVTVYLLTGLISGDKKIALGLTIFLGSNVIIGKIYYIAHAIIFISTKSQLLVMEKLPFLQ